jgi:hypothetical protein
MKNLQARVRRETLAAFIEPWALLVGLWGYIILGVTGPIVAFWLYVLVALLQAYGWRGLLWNLGPPIAVGALLSEATFLPIPRSDRFLLGFLAVQSVWIAVVHFIQFIDVARSMRESGDLQQFHDAMTRPPPT